MIKVGLFAGFIYAMATLPSGMGTHLWSYTFICVVIGGIIGAILNRVIKWVNIDFAIWNMKRKLGKCPRVWSACSIWLLCWQM